MIKKNTKYTYNLPGDYMVEVTALYKKTARLWVCQINEVPFMTLLILDSELCAIG